MRHETTSHTQEPNHELSPVEYCLALYDFSGETLDDLDFVAGDRIQILEWVGDDWLKGKLGHKSGMFPAGYVELESAGSNGENL